MGSPTNQRVPSATNHLIDQNLPVLTQNKMGGDKEPGGSEETIGLLFLRSFPILLGLSSSYSLTFQFRNVDRVFLQNLAGGQECR